MAEPEPRHELVMTRIGGGRSAIGLAVAFVALLAGGWMLLVLGGSPDEPAAASPVNTSAGVAGAPTPTQAPTAASSTAPAPLPTPSRPRATAPAGEQLVVNFVTGERRYELPLNMEAPGVFHGGTSLTYPLGLGAKVELIQVAGSAGEREATTAGGWQAVFYAAGGADREVSILEYAERARPALRDLPGILRHGYHLLVTADGGHYPQLVVRLVSPYGLRLSRPGACEGGWRFSHPDERC